ncbi:MAG: S1 RNA-binding domain-containing protein [Deltaproteobacteria bacterium]|nr:S1 RNA-binding domain-containing protein [Deltaproteobacteria bacterium]
MAKNRVQQLDGDLPFGDLDYRMPTRRKLAVGEVVEGVVVAIGDSDVFVDVGAKAEGTIDIKEITQDGELQAQIGDKVHVYIVALDPELRLSYSLGRAHLNQQMLEDACEMGIPVDGKVTGVNKGGFDISLGGVRAFCPVSQIDVDFCEDPSVFLDQTLRFRVTKYEQEGRNIVVSRRALLAEEREEAASAIREQLFEGAEFKGTVKSLQPYGAFVDIGGVQGMVHISEICHRRIEHPSEALTVGQTVKVRISKIDRDPKHPDRERIGLSIRALLGDPWDEALAELNEGDAAQGRVVRIQPFGAFVELRPGVDGLIHISELSDRRIRHPSDVVSLGQDVQVTILKIDHQARRLSLSLRTAGATADAADAGDITVGAVVDVVVDQVKPFGLFVQLKGAGRRMRGLIPAEEAADGPQTNLRRAFPEGTELKALITAYDPSTGKIRLSLQGVGEQEQREAYQQFVGDQRRAASDASLGSLGAKLAEALKQKR